VGVVNRRLRAVAVLVGLAASLLATRSAVAVPPAPAEVPRSQRVYFVTESVGLSAKDALPGAFPAGWQVTVDGKAALFVEQLESKFVRTRIAQTPSVFGDVAIVAAGHNYPYWDPARFDRSIDSMVDALHAAGVKRIYWVTLREVKEQYVTHSAWVDVQPYAWYFPIVNEHLRQALTRHPDLSLIDWTSVADRPGITYDAIHLNRVGAALYAQTVASTVLSTANRPLAGTVTRVAVTGQAGITSTPAAVAVNLAVTDPRSAGFLTAFPCGTEPPLVASSTFDRGRISSTAAIVPVTPDGTICVLNNEATHVVVDVTGSFPVGQGLVPLTPARLVDTRDAGPRVPAGTVLRVPALGTHGIPADAKAVAITVTATDPSADGFVTVAPCGAAPSGTANLNFRAGATVPNLAIVAPGDGGSICLRSNVDTHLLVDATAAFQPSADMGVVDPVRLLDTRDAPGGRLAAGGSVRVHVAGAHGVPATPSGVVLDLTGVGPGADGFLTAYPCAAGAPLASSLNLTAGENRGNLVIVAPDAAGDVCVSSHEATDVVIDLFGWTGASFVGTTPTRLADTRAG
jgi:hypothetical protein